MKITSIEVSCFELPDGPRTFRLSGKAEPRGTRWKLTRFETGPVPIQVMRVKTDAELEGVCTVGDWRYTTIAEAHLRQLRELAVGEDPLHREELLSKLKYGTRFLYAEPGWYGCFDNCLWDIAGKAAGLPVAALIGGAGESCPAYHNVMGEDGAALLKDAEAALSQGYRSLKDHLSHSPGENMRIFRELRKTVGEDVALMHDAALANYDFVEAYEVGKALEELKFLFYEEPLPDRQLDDYLRLAGKLAIPLAGPETFMHDADLSALWLKMGAVKVLRVNARHGLTPVLKLAHFAELLHTHAEPNTIGPLFGLVHAHTVCGVANIRKYEVFPPLAFTHLAKEIGLLNPVIPEDGSVRYPADRPGWGAEWDWDYFEKARIGTL